MLYSWWLYEHYLCCTSETCLQITCHVELFEVWNFVKLTWYNIHFTNMDRHGRLLSRVGSQKDNNPQDMLPTSRDPGVSGGRQMDRSDTYPSHIYRNVYDTHHCDIPAVYKIIEQLQLKIQSIEEELIRLKAQTCQHGCFINMQTDTANELPTMSQ